MGGGTQWLFLFCLESNDVEVLCTLMVALGRSHMRDFGAVLLSMSIDTPSSRSLW